MAAIVQVRSCGRCGAPLAPGAACFGCGLPGGSATAVADPMAGAVTAPPVRWLLALLVDLIIAAAPAVLAWLALGTAPPLPRVMITVLGALIGLGAVGGLLLGGGRALGGVLLSQRLLDRLTGEPVRVGRLAGRLVGGSGWGLTVVDLRRETDPSRQIATHTRAAESLADAADADAAAITVPRQALPRPTVPSSATSRSVPSAYAGPVASGTAPAAVEIALSNGERYQVRDALLLGRSPEEAHAPSGRRPALLTWPDLSRRLATTHLLLERDGAALWVTDLDSPTGTALVSPDGQEAPLIPRRRTAAPAGTVLRCGGRTVTVLGTSP